MSVPLGLQFGANPGRIDVQGNGQGLRSSDDPIIDTAFGLRVQPNQTLALVGSDVALEGGTLKTAGGRIELGSVAGSSLVSLSPIDKGWSLGYSNVPTFRDIQLSGAAAVDASGNGGGDIQVQGRRVTLRDGSQIEASTLGAEPGGTLAVIASESVEASGSSTDSRFVSTLAAQVYRGATGDGGQITSGGCAVGQNKFTIAGRGGLPPNPREPLIGEAVLTNWATLSGAGSREQGAENREINSTSSAPTQIVEATEWVVNGKGEVVLTANAPTDTLDIPWVSSTGCHASEP